MKIGFIWCGENWPSLVGSYVEHVLKGKSKNG